MNTNQGIINPSQNIDIGKTRSKIRSVLGLAVLLTLTMNASQAVEMAVFKAKVPKEMAAAFMEDCKAPVDADGNVSVNFGWSVKNPGKDRQIYLRSMLGGVNFSEYYGFSAAGKLIRLETPSGTFDGSSNKALPLGNFKLKAFTGKRSSSKGLTVKYRFLVTFQEKPFRPIAWQFFITPPSVTEQKGEQQEIEIKDLKGKITDDDNIYYTPNASEADVASLDVLYKTYVTQIIAPQSSAPAACAMMGGSVYIPSTTK